MGNGTITAVERQAGGRNRRYHVFVDGIFAFEVHEDVLIKHRLLKGETVDPERVREVLRDEELQAAYMKTLRWLGARQRTIKEIEGYLKRHKFEQMVTEEVIARLKQQGYIDDGHFSRTLAEERLVSHGKGKRWIQQELLHKGVDRAIVQATLSGIEEEEELRAATAAARKRWRALAGKGELKDSRRKLAAYLARRGFSPSVAADAIRIATGEDASGEWGGGEEEWTWE